MIIRLPRLRYFLGIPYLWIVGMMTNGNEIVSTALMFGLVYGIIEIFSNRNNDEQPPI
jgi:hypothetical protein